LKQWKKDAMGMRLMKDVWLRMGCGAAMWVLALTLAATAMAQAVITTTVQGTVYLANGQPSAGTLTISWPAFTTAAGQSVAADRMTVTIGTDGFVSVNLAPNVGATPAGEYYTAVYSMSDGTTSTQYCGEQGVCGSGDRGTKRRRRTGGDRRNADRAALFVRRSDTAAASGG
jgi:hypothetical protein